MEHSVEAYLRRQTTETLELLLESYTREENRMEYGYLVNVIQNVLAQRQENV